MMKDKNGVRTVDVLNMMFEIWECFSDEEKITLASMLERKIAKAAVGYDDSMDKDEETIGILCKDDGDVQHVMATAQNIHTLAGYLFKEIDQEWQCLEGNGKFLDQISEGLLKLWNAEIIPVMTEDADDEVIFIEEDTDDEFSFIQ